MIILRILGYLWSAPLTVFGLLLCGYYWPRSIRWSDGCLEVVSRHTLIGGRWVAAQTFGWLIAYRDESCRRTPRLRVHERVHTLQAMIGGFVLFPLAYGAHWLWRLLMVGDWQLAYRTCWAERQAYRIEAEFADGKRPGAWGS